MERHYPHFDVMTEAEHWDEHTRRIVTERVKRAGKPPFLKPHEIETLQSLSMHILFEDRKELLLFVVEHIDKTCHDQKGEGQKKPGIPPEDQLIRQGIQALDYAASQRHGRAFKDCGVEQQFGLVADLQLGQLEAVQQPDLPAELFPWADPNKTKTYQKAFFKKVLILMVEALSSHPLLWSEMGYAGPAYPRGYYRIGLGLTDPWEPHA